MEPYNVEIFDRGINFKCNTVCEEIKYKSDYMDPEKWNLDLVNIPAPNREDIIHVQRSGEDYIGLVTAFNEKKDGVMTVSVNEFPAIFDIDIIRDATDIEYSLENFIKNLITEQFIEGDTSMHLPITVNVLSTTNDWVLDFKIKNEPKEDEPAPPLLVTEFNLFDDVILPAFLQYQIVLTYSINLNTRQIEINIGKNTADTLVIEADLPNIIEKEVTIKKSSKQINKVIVYNTDDYTDTVTYYLHSDDTFDTEDDDRQLPVLFDNLEAKQETEDQEGTEVVTKTFLEAAHEKAEATFQKNKYTNLIELKMLMEDELIKPKQLEIGQVVSIISEGVVYNSILTGREVNTTTKLIFGTVRLELTKLLKGRA